MPSFPEEKPDTLANSRQQFGILMTVAITAFVVVTVFSLIFKICGGAQ